jgi:hypothetical protein
MTGAESVRGLRLAGGALIAATCVRAGRPSATSSRVHDLEHVEQRAHASARSCARGRCKRCPTQGLPSLAQCSRRRKAQAQSEQRPWNMAGAADNGARSRCGVLWGEAIGMRDQ